MGLAGFACKNRSHLPWLPGPQAHSYIAARQTVIKLRGLGVCRLIPHPSLLGDRPRHHVRFWRVLPTGWPGLSPFCMEAAQSIVNWAREYLQKDYLYIKIAASSRYWLSHTVLPARQLLCGFGNPFFGRYWLYGSLRYACLQKAFWQSHHWPSLWRLIAELPFP